jgi:hypothetical protein
VLPNQWSPRVGAIYDFTGQGRSKIFASYGRYFENVPLDLADTLFVTRPFTVSRVPTSDCYPLDPGDPRQIEGCRAPENRLTTGAPSDPNRKWNVFGGDRALIDPAIEAQSTDEIVAGAEYQIVSDARIGLSYTHRHINRVIENVSNDEGRSYVVGNPGFGATADFPKATRDYDALTVFFQKSFSSQWLAMASYTLSFLRGNYTGSHMGTDFDLISLMPNREGPLPADRRHAIKVFGAKEFSLPGNIAASVGLSYTGTSGAPLDVLGSHPRYGAGQAFILPRGAGGELPWVHSIDANLALGYRLSSRSVLSVNVDVFNLFNFDGETGRDQLFTFASVRPIKGGEPSDLPKAGEAACATAAGCRYKLVKLADGTPFDPAARNPSYGNATAYQAPRTIRIGARLTF